MSTQYPGSTPKRRDPDLAGAEAAMHRAAKRARRRAEEGGTIRVGVTNLATIVSGDWRAGLSPGMRPFGVRTAAPEGSVRPTPTIALDCGLQGPGRLRHCEP